MLPYLWIAWAAYAVGFLHASWSAGEKIAGLEATVTRLRREIAELADADADEINPILNAALVEILDTAEWAWRGVQ